MDERRGGHGAGWDYADIQGASYGLADVTAKVQQLYNNGRGQKRIYGNNATLGDSWVGTVKSFTIVYFWRGREYTKVVRENEYIDLPDRR